MLLIKELPGVSPIKFPDLELADDIGVTHSEVHSHMRMLIAPEVLPVCCAAALQTGVKCQELIAVDVRRGFTRLYRDIFHLKVPPQCANPAADRAVAVNQLFRCLCQFKGHISAMAAT